MDEVHRHEEWKPASEEFAITLEEILSGKRKDRRRDAIDQAIKTETEALRGYLRAYQAKRLAEVRVKFVDDLMGMPHKELVQEIETSRKEFSEASQALQKVNSGAEERIERIRTLRELRKRLDDFGEE